MRSKKLSCRVDFLLIAAALMTSAAPSLCQEDAAASSQSASSPNTSRVATMTFDVASVRENKNVDVNTGFGMSGGFAPGTTTVRLINWDVENLISYAYGLERYQIVNAPHWPFPTVFVIEAKGDSDADAKLATLTPKQQNSEQEHMLQILLQDRFKLKTHWETREGDVYSLVVAKGGPKLSAAGSTQRSAEEAKMFGNQSPPPIYQKNDEQGYDFIAHGCSMEELAEILAGQFGRPVMDRTELTGKYDFVLKYKGRWDRDRDASDLDPMPPMDRALQEELGLKVDSAKGPVKMLIIDHIEKPTEN